jgi:hypothetical protein
LPVALGSVNGSKVWDVGSYDNHAVGSARLDGSILGRRHVVRDKDAVHRRRTRVIGMWCQGV